MILLNKVIKNCNLNFYNIKFKYKCNILYIKGYFGYLKICVLQNINIYIVSLKQKLLNIYININNGWIGLLFLNGLGFKSTKKYNFLKKKYWRFNVGHSHVFLYFTPKNVILKSKNRYICLFSYKKSQIFDITEKIKEFHIPDVYKGVGIKYPNEIIKLKKGKIRQ